MYYQQSNTVIAPPPIVEKIMSYSDLQDGWDCGIGYRPSLLTIEKTINLYDIFNYLGFGVDSTPMTNGGITLTFSYGEFFIDVIVNPDGTYAIREEHGIGVEYEIINEENNVTIDRILEKLNATIQKCISLEPLIEENTFQARNDFKVTASVISETEFQSSVGIAPYIIQAQSASI